MLILLLVYALCVSRKWYCVAVSSANLPLFVQFTFEQIKHCMVVFMDSGGYHCFNVTVNMKKLIESCLPHGEDLEPAICNTPTHLFCKAGLLLCCI